MAKKGKGSTDEASPLRPGRRHSKCLIVDGYNILAQLWRMPLSDIPNLEEARTGLLEDLAEYQAFYGEQVYLVFDAHHTPQPSVEMAWRGVRVIYTALHETADQRIESLVYRLRLTYQNITVASSDAAEQQVTFGGGGLRISARELIDRIGQAQTSIHKTLKHGHETRHNVRLGDILRQDIAKIFENWRRQ